MFSPGNDSDEEYELSPISLYYTSCSSKNTKSEFPTKEHAFKPYNWHPMDDVCIKWKGPIIHSRNTPCVRNLGKIKLPARLLLYDIFVQDINTLDDMNHDNQHKLLIKMKCKNDVCCVNPSHMIPIITKNKGNKFIRVCTNRNKFSWGKVDFPISMMAKYNQNIYKEIMKEEIQAFKSDFFEKNPQERVRQQFIFKWKSFLDSGVKETKQISGKRKKRGIKKEEKIKKQKQK